MGGKTRPPYPEAFRDKAIELARSSDNSINQIADELGVSGQTLRNWVHQAEVDAGKRGCVRRNQPGPYQIQAAINAVHADASTVEATDWSQIVALYDQLFAVAPTPVVALNRAIAIGEVQGPAAAFALVAELDLDNYYAFHATRADLLSRLGRHEEAAVAYERAASLAPTDPEREFLKRGGRA